jgi:hypothetical protein
MSVAVEIRSHTEDTANVRQSLAIMAACAVVVPSTILLHEVGHVFGYLVFGFKSLTLHYASSSFAGEREFWSLLRAGDPGAANRIAGVTQAGLSALFGLVVSYLIVVIGLWGLTRFRAVVFLGFAAGSAARFPLVIFLVLLGRSEHTDEAHVAQALGVPQALLSVLGVLAFLAAAVGGAFLLGRRGRGRDIAPAFAGVIAGTVLWMGLIGRHVLP